MKINHILPVALSLAALTITFSINSPCWANAPIMITNAPIQPGPVDPVVRQKVMRHWQLQRQADAIKLTDPVKACTLYKESLECWPNDYEVLMSLGDCEEAITGDAKQAAPYYYKALFDEKGNYDGTHGLPANSLLKAALIFEEAGDLTNSVKLYNYAVEHDINTLGPSVVPVKLPILTTKDTLLDVACYSHIALGLDHQGPDEQEETINHFLTAIQIKDCASTRDYWAFFKKRNAGIVENYAKTHVLKEP